MKQVMDTENMVRILRILDARLAELKKKPREFEKYASAMGWRRLHP